MKKQTKQTENTIFFRYSPCNIPSVDHRYFESYFSEVGPVKKCSLIRSSKRQGNNSVGTDGVSENRGFGFIKYLSQNDAVTAAKNYNGVTLNVDNTSLKLWVELASDAVQARHAPTQNRHTPTSSIHVNQQPIESTLKVDIQAPDRHIHDEEESDLQRRKKSCRVILRNVSFYATEKNIRKIMEERFGKVLEVNLPLVPNLDEHEEDVQKTKHQQQPGHRGFAFVTFSDAQSARKAVEQNKEPVILKKRALEISFSLSKVQHLIGKRKRSDITEKALESNNDVSKNDEVMNEEDIDVSSSASKNHDEDQEADNSYDDENREEGDDDDIDHDNEEVEVNDNEDEQDINLLQQQQQQQQPREMSTKNSLFLRNIPFDSTRHDIFDLFKRFGHIDSIYLVKDKDTGLGKGSAFVHFRDESSFLQALAAGKLDGVDSTPDAAFVSSKKIITGEANSNVYGTGLYLNGRRILVDKAIDRSTAESFKVERDEDGKLIGKKIGKDRRNLYLKNEGRVQEGAKTDNSENVWEILPRTDQEKRGRAHQDKSVKLRSPLFFVNPFRLSIRNLSKHVDEAGLRKLIVLGITRGLENHLVTRTDLIAHWRAGGEMTLRDIMKKISDAELNAKDKSEDNVDPLIPPFLEKIGIKAFVPSVYIDRDFESTKGSKKDAPSRGFGFVEFTHHAHALACLRELNNNPSYSAEYVSGGRKAVDLKRRLSREKGGRKQSSKGDEYSDIVGDDGVVRIPRLIVEFTVENKVMAKKQAERRSLQLANKSKQRSVDDTRNISKETNDVKKRSRGALQREKKRLKRAEVKDT